MENLSGNKYKIVSRKAGQPEVDEFVGDGYTFKEAQEILRDVMSEFLSERHNVTYWTAKSYSNFNKESIEADEDYVPAFEFIEDGWYELGYLIFSRDEIDDVGFDSFNYDSVSYSIVEIDS